MRSDWTTVSLKEASLNVSYGYTESANEEKVGPHFLRITDIQGGVVNWTSVPYCPIDDKQYRKYRLSDGDIVIARTGNSTGENYLFKVNNDSVFASYLIKFSVDKSSFDPAFVWYNLRSPRWWHFVNGFKTGSAQAGANAKTLGLFEFKYPPLPEQKAIAHILGTLDDKIELNRQMNETLEQMAQALFKSWFVDFDPVIDKALAAGNEIPEPLQKRAKLRAELPNDQKLFYKSPELVEGFPDSFTFTEELGWIPEGWEVDSFNWFSKVIGGYAFKSKDFLDSGSYPVVKIKNINGAGGVDLDDCQSLAYEPVDIDSKFKLQNGDLLMAMTGATVGKFGLVVPRGKTQPLLNQRVAKYISSIKTDSRIWFIYFYLKQEHIFDHIVNSAYGSAQPNISATDLLRTPAIKIPKRLLSSFNDLAESNMQKVLSNVKTNSSLTKLRDTLLPKLISGELRVPDAQRLIAEHA